MEIKKILIVFKTHLDIGFTDFAGAVKEKYMREFIPNAIKVSRELDERGGEARFKWTTGSWLIYEYLKQADDAEREALEEAIRRGNICWHGLPCTTHTEFMTKELFQYGLSLSGRLDARFGKKTIAAKMTDVPGHTKAIIPLLRQAGIEMLHIGVNPASAVPEVPPIFRWQADSGEAVTVIYSGEYGEFAPLGDTGVALYFAHTNDNLGSQSAEEVIALFADLRRRFPDAELVASDLNAAAEVLREVEDSLPVVTEEIGDSWIHGVATDPKKAFQFRALSRVYAALPAGVDKETLGAGLLMIPEHTWGLDEKTHLHDNAHYARKEFKALRGEPNYKKMEASWAEQRDFMYHAVSGLNKDLAEKTAFLTDEAQREPVSTAGCTPAAPGEALYCGGFELRFNNRGEITHLAGKGKVIADESHRLCTLLYEKFSYDNYITFHNRYHRIEDDWAWQDFTKIGMEEACGDYTAYYPEAAVYPTDDSVIVDYSFCEEARTLFGAPEKMQLVISPLEGNLLFDLAWFNKPANRMAEAFWFGFCTKADNLRISKLGMLIDPQHVVSRGNRNLHATDKGVFWDGLSVMPVDSALVSPQKPCVLDYPNTIPPTDEGVYFGLYNNLWGTNFPMWYDEDARFRFYLQLK